MSKKKKKALEAAALLKKAPKVKNLPMRITETTVAETRAASRNEILNAFQYKPPMQGVLPNTHKGMAMDNALNSAVAFASMNAIYSEGLQFMGYPYLAELTQRAEYRRPSEIIAKEMTRKWIKLSSVSEDDDKTAKIKQIVDEMQRLKVQSVVRKATEMDGWFGRSQIYLDMGVEDDDRDELRIPLLLNKNKIGKGSLKRLVLVEPLWTYPNQYNSTDPLDPTFYRPQSWFVMGKEIHASRLLTIIGRPMPDILKPAYMFGGLSLSQMAKPYVDNWLLARQSVSDLIRMFSQFGLKTKMEQTMNAGAAQNLRNRVQFFNAQRDNRGMMVIDKDTEEFFNIAAPLGSLDKLQAQAQEHMSSVTGIPLSILLGITPSGLNASNDGEIRTFYQWIEAQQESMLQDVVKTLIDVIQLSLFGDIDKDITFAWEPLWSMSDKEAAEIRNLDADSDVKLVEAGIISEEEVRQRLASEEDSPYQGLDVSKVPEPPEDDGDLPEDDEKDSETEE